jgi:asparagine synthetase B (glutamine-hydrolysing)
MCSILLTNKQITNFDDVNYFLKYRGPDKTTQTTIDNWTFVHNLLSITGEFTPQPLTQNNVALIFNGEIYNYTQTNKDCKSDGYFILEQYFEHKENFIKKLDGEFALALIDFNTKELFFSGDLFVTKPIFVAKENEYIGIASYKSALKALGFKDPKRLEPNTYYKVSLDTLQIQSKTIYDWDLAQTIDTYDLWNDAFKESLNKRTQQTRGQFLVPLSSGHDSGAIVCGLQNLIHNDNFLTYSFIGNEDSTIIQNRLKNHTNKIFKNGIPRPEKEKVQQDIRDNVEHYFYGPNPYINMQEGVSDIGAIGLYYLLKEVKESHNIKVQLSGQGGDEIMSTIQTYGFQTSNPSFWPDDLTTVFPWGNFYFGANWSYLNKEECIAGSLGIETRYPLLDKNVVQAFLNLTANLKNKFYKAPIHNFFTKYNFPFMANKLGFNVQVY